MYSKEQMEESLKVYDSIKSVGEAVRLLGMVKSRNVGEITTVCCDIGGFGNSLPFTRLEMPRL